MERSPIIDRETVDMLREMDAITDDDDLLLELIDDFLTHSALLVDAINLFAMQQNQVELAAKAHSLKGASLNIGTLALFQICDKIELMARNHQLLEANAQLPALDRTFRQTNNRLIEIRARTERGENINDLLG